MVRSYINYSYVDLTECDNTYPDQCRTPRLGCFFDKPDSGDFPDAFFVSNQIDISSSHVLNTPQPCHLITKLRIMVGSMETKVVVKETTPVYYSVQLQTVWFLLVASKAS